MDVAFVIRKRLEELGLEQRDLARAARVTESYVSQLLTGKKAPPAPNRTEIYERMERCLELPAGELAKVAAAARTEELLGAVGQTPEPLYPRIRDLILRKCRGPRVKQVRSLIERRAFGELERLVAQRLLDVAGLGPAIFHLSPKQAAAVDAIIDSWDIDLATFELEIVLHRGAGTERVRRFGFVETGAGDQSGTEPGLRKFLADRSLSGTATPAELAFLEGLKVPGRRPTALYYYRELQNLRDPLHFQ